MKHSSEDIELDDKMVISQIDIIEEKLAELKSREAPRQIGYSSSNQVMKILKHNMRKSYTSYKSAKELYDNRLISASDLQRVADDYSKLKVKYLQEKDRYTRQNIPRASGSGLVSLITELELRREELINKLNYLRVFSETEGSVYAIKSNIGNYVGSSDEVMVLETGDTSFVVCKLTQDEATKVQNGMEVKIYALSTDETYRGHIQTIGNLSLNTESKITTEVSLKEVTIKVVFDEEGIKLPLNERVKVWFYRPLF